MTTRKHPLTELAQDVARDHREPTLAICCEALTDSDMEAWLDYTLADETAPQQVMSDIVDEFQDDARAVLFLRCLLKGDSAPFAGQMMRQGLKRVAAQDLLRKARSHLWVESFLSPLRTALDHHDAIKADRRALAREFNR